jgi:hypothetical protein
LNNQQSLETSSLIIAQAEGQKPTKEGKTAEEKKETLIP